MSLYKRGGMYWYKFKYAGVTIRESTGLTSYSAAGDVERKRHVELSEAGAGVTPKKKRIMFSAASDGYLKAKCADWAPKTAIIENTT